MQRERPEYDSTRREFMRTFGRETVRNAGAVIGAANDVRRIGGAAARELLELDQAAGRPLTERLAGAPVDSFSSAYVVARDALVVLDQRQLPATKSFITCRAPSEVAAAMRTGAITPGPVVAEVAAYALTNVLAASDAMAGRPRDQAFRAAANTLRVARPDISALTRAIDGAESVYDAATARMDVPRAGAALWTAVADAMAAFARRVAEDAALDHAALGRHGADLLERASKEVAADRPVSVLMHGSMGQLACGLVGTGLAIVQSLVARGVAVHVWVTEAAPTNEGARVAAYELAQLDVAHTVIPDSAVGWLVGTRPLDGVLLRGDRVAANGDTGALMGSRNVATIAAAAEIPVYVCAPRSAHDLESTDGHGFASAVRSAGETLGAGPASDGQPSRSVAGGRLEPSTDFVPRDLVTALLTEAGPG